MPANTTIRGESCVWSLKTRCIKLDTSSFAHRLLLQTLSACELALDPVGFCDRSKASPSICCINSKFLLIAVLPPLAACRTKQERAIAQQQTRSLSGLECGAPFQTRGGPDLSATDSNVVSF